MRTTIRHGGVLKCDAEVPKTPEQLANMATGGSTMTRCPEQFTSYSAVSVIRAQAVSAGWGRVWAWQVTGDMAATARIRQDVCPEHNAIAGANAQRREEILEAQRVQLKADKAAERSQKAAAKLAERAQLNNARNEKKAAKAKERADSKAARAAAKAEATAKKLAARTWSDALRADREKRKAERAARKQAGVHTAGITVQAAEPPITTTPENPS